MNFLHESNWSERWQAARAFAREQIAPLFPLLLIFGAVFLNAPFFCRACVISLDSDALAMIAQLQAVPNWLGWNNGFYFNSFLTSAASALLRTINFAQDDYALAYQGVSFLALLALALGTYSIVARATQRRLAGALAMLAGITLPGILHLALHTEDNLIAEAMQLQYLGVYLWYLSRAAHRSRWGRAEVGLGISLWLGIIAHHELNVLWVTPFAMFWFLRAALSRREILKRVMLVCGVALSLVLLMYIPLTYTWTGRWSVRSWLEHVALWLYPSRFYQGYYFFYQFGWDLPRQFGNIGRGVTALVRFENPTLDPFLLTAYVGLLMLLGLPYWRALRSTRVAAVLTLFTLIHIPHSLVYESFNLERWDAVVVPIVCLTAIVLTQLRHARANTRGLGRVHALCALALATALLLGNIFFYTLMRDRAERAAHNSAWQTLQPILLTQVEIPNTSRAARPVLVLSEQEFQEFYRLSAMYFDYAHNVYGVTRGGTFFYSSALYPKRTAISRAEFFVRTRGAQLVSTSTARAWIPAGADSVIMPPQTNP